MSKGVPLFLQGIDHITNYTPQFCPAFGIRSKHKYGCFVTLQMSWKGLIHSDDIMHHYLKLPSVLHIY